MAHSLERWLGKVAVVTGANSGIGAAISKRLSEEGIIVVGLDKNVEQINETTKELAKGKGQLHSFKTDVTREEDILNAFKWIKENVGPLSILVNCAGVYFPSSITEGKTEHWKAVLDVNLIGVCVVCREAIKMMIEHNIDGHIINISSLTSYKIIHGLQMYAPSKHAVRAVTETIRLELLMKKSKIKIGCISPGTVDTPLMRINLETIDAAALASLETLAPLADMEFLKPQNIADAAVYVLSTPPNVRVEELIVRPIGEPF